MQAVRFHLVEEDSETQIYSSTANNKNEAVEKAKEYDSDSKLFLFFGFLCCGNYFWNGEAGEGNGRGVII
jgi:hypothetical protein